MSNILPPGPSDEAAAREAALLRREVAYLRLLVYKLSLPRLAEQHPKYLPLMREAPHMQEMPR